MLTYRELLLTALSVFFAGYAILMTLMLKDISDQNKAQQRVLVCFDEAGKATTDFTNECRRVAIRELK